MLGRFEGDMEALAGVEVAPAVAAAAGQLRSLLDLVPEQRVRDWAAQCAASHQHLSDKVCACCCQPYLSSPALLQHDTVHGVGDAPAVHQ